MDVEDAEEIALQIIGRCPGTRPANSPKPATAMPSQSSGAVSARASLRKRVGLANRCIVSAITPAPL